MAVVGSPIATVAVEVAVAMAMEIAVAPVVAAVVTAVVAAIAAPITAVVAITVAALNLDEQAARRGGGESGRCRSGGRGRGGEHGERERDAKRRAALTQGHGSSFPDGCLRTH